MQSQSGTTHWLAERPHAVKGSADVAAIASSEASTVGPVPGDAAALRVIAEASIPHGAHKVLADLR